MCYFERADIPLLSFLFSFCLLYSGHVRPVRLTAGNFDFYSDLLLAYLFINLTIPYLSMALAWTAFLVLFYHHHANIHTDKHVSNRINPFCDLTGSFVAGLSHYISTLLCTLMPCSNQKHLSQSTTHLD